jgi:hypothetical protein
MEIFANPNYFSHDEAMRANFDLECVKLKKAAILTDFLSFAPMSYVLVSNKVYSIMIKYNLGNHRFFAATVGRANGESIGGYRFLYKEVFDYDLIDFSRCKFIKGNSHDGFKNVVFNSKEEFFKDRFVKVEKVALTKIPNGEEMFKVKLPVGIVISAAMQKDLAAANVSGIKFRKIEVEIGKA